MVDGTKQLSEFNALQQWRNSSFFIVCSEPKAIMWHFKKDIVFVRYSSCMCSPYSSLASVGLAQARPNNIASYRILIK